MFNYFKKYLLIVIFLGVIPSIFGMENSQKSHWSFSVIIGCLPKFSLPSGSYQSQNAKLLNIGENVLKNGQFEENEILKIKILLINEADPNLKIGHQTLLHIAALYQNEELFNYLLQHDADCNVFDGYGHKPLEVKNATKKLINIIKNQDNKTENEKLDKIIECVNHGANPDSRIENETLLHWAIRNNYHNLIDCLLLCGANPNICDDREFTPLVALLSSRFNSGLDENERKIVKKLLQYNADAITPLAWAISMRDVQTAKLLISYTDVIDYNYTYLGAAIQKNMLVKELCNTGTSIINKKEFDVTLKKTAFQMAALQPTKEPIEAILTCARPTKIQQQDEKANIRWIVRGLIWAFIYDKGESNLSILPKDIKFLILSLLPEDYFNDSNGALYSAIHLYPICKAKFPGYKQYYFFRKTKNRVTWLIEILKMQNSDKKTASQLLVENTDLCDDCKNERKVLLNGTQIQNDYNTLVENPNLLNPVYLAQNPEIKKKAEKNLAWQIYDNIRTEWSQNSSNPD